MTTLDQIKQHPASRAEIALKNAMLCASIVENCLDFGVVDEARDHLRLALRWHAKAREIGVDLTGALRAEDKRVAALVADAEARFATFA